MRDWLLDTTGDGFTFTGIFHERYLVGILVGFDEEDAAMLFRLAFL
ncbi:hypothetical protein [Qipengyuania gelatinilytica]|uniref:Uncharacterized protein n=1 Tax=Qipengyuania gelatinilytica TaxID=2867231 RepID=A0ABX9A4L3_9SPHN|nr:hypothetical protein [Qipengyuania gelatinilytica]QZD96218.1 hypothetical protein K3136_05880 [Qipengyuania gelatinilytica]